jgi:hypothetical protein
MSPLHFNHYTTMPATLKKTVYHVTLLNIETEEWELNTTVDTYEQALQRANTLRAIDGWISYSSIGIQKCVIQTTLIKMMPTKVPSILNKS